MVEPLFIILSPTQQKTIKISITPNHYGRRFNVYKTAF